MSDARSIRQTNSPTRKCDDYVAPGANQAATCSDMLARDSDADGYGDSCDNCPLTSNANQADRSAGGAGAAYLFQRSGSGFTETRRLDTRCNGMHGSFSRGEVCQPAWSWTSTAMAPAETQRLMAARCSFMTAMPTPGMTTAAPVLRGARGRMPRLAQIRVSVPC